MNKSLKKKKKTKKNKEQYIEDELVKLGKDISNFQLMVQRKVETIQEYVRLLKLSKAKYQNCFMKTKHRKKKSKL